MRLGRQSMIETSTAVFGQRCSRYLVAFSLRCCQDVSQLPFHLVHVCLDRVMMQIVERCGKSDAQLWNCGTQPLNAL